MQTTITQYQVYIVRGNEAPSLDGCWGSENSIFDNKEDAQDAANDLEMIYGEDGVEFIVQPIE